MQITCFKAYDIRGKLIEQLDENVAYRIGRACAEYLNAKTVVVGGDVRLTSEPLKLALTAGLIDGGADVSDLGMTGTEEIYFATKYLKVDGGIEVTASHNPIDYNGMKLVKNDSKPISGDTGLFAIQNIAQEYSNTLVEERLAAYSKSKASDHDFLNGKGSVSIELLKQSAKYHKISAMAAYVEHIISYIDASKITPIKLVVNAGNGAAGDALDAIQAAFEKLNVPIDFIKVHHTPDGSFPNGIPNPLLPESRADTANAVIENKADMGIAWDGDFDRCFLFDESGEFVEGYYIVGLLAQAFLDKDPGAKIIYDPRVFWNTEDIVSNAGGVPIKSKTGHAFIKERMRADDAVYGGEMSAHHYFKDFFYCDSGMVPWLLVMELISSSGKSLSQLVEAMMAAYPSPGEINRSIADPAAAIARVRAHYEADALVVNETDGVSMEFAQWRFNLRMSNTEPLVRLNLETRGDHVLMKAREQDILAILESAEA